MHARRKNILYMAFSALLLATIACKSIQAPAPAEFPEATTAQAIVQDGRIAMLTLQP